MNDFLPENEDLDRAIAALDAADSLRAVGKWGCALPCKAEIPCYSRNFPSVTFSLHCGRLLLC